MVDEEWGTTLKGHIMYQRHVCEDKALYKLVYFLVKEDDKPGMRLYCFA